MVRITLDLTTDHGLSEVVQWILYALDEEPMERTVIAEIHASSES